MGLIKSKFSKKPLIGGLPAQEPTPLTNNTEKKTTLGGIKAGGLKLGGSLNNAKQEEVAGEVTPEAKEQASEEINKSEPKVVILEENAIEATEEVKQEEGEEVETTSHIPETMPPQEDIVEVTQEAPLEVEKAKTKKKAPAKKKPAVVADSTADTVDEAKRLKIEEMDSVMHPIIAPTTEKWESEKNEVLDALKDISISQDMSTGEVKQALASLDELRFEIFPRQHDAERCYDGTVQIYKRVKALAIAEGTASNAEARKALGIVALRNYVTPEGAVIDLNEYMLYIEEKHKFYQKMLEAIQFKSYSLVNFNKTLAAEKV